MEAGTREERWERRTEWALTLAALAFLLAYAFPVIQPDHPAWVARLADAVVLITWPLFLVDYLVRLRLAEDRRSFVLHNVPDLLVILLPLLRPLWLLRLVTLVTVLNRHATVALRGRIGTYVVGGASLLAFVGAVATLDAERGQPGATIETFGDAIWWALTTMTTVGYGDLYPVTAQGRLAAAGLMVGGVALLGVVTASVVSWLVDRIAEEREEEESALEDELEAVEQGVLTELRTLRAEVATLREELRAGRSEGTPGT